MPRIKDEKTKSLAIENYSRYQDAVDQDTGNVIREDKEAVFVHLIDKLQAGRIGNEYYFNFKRVGLERPTRQQRSHIKKILLPLIIKYAKFFFRLDMSDQAKYEFVAFVIGEILRFHNNGYEKEASGALETLLV